MVEIIGRSCKYCGSVFTYDDEDVRCERHSQFYVFCPQCGDSVYVLKPKEIKPITESCGICKKEITFDEPIYDEAIWRRNLDEQGGESFFIRGRITDPINKRFYAICPECHKAGWTTKPVIGQDDEDNFFMNVNHNK